MALRHLIFAGLILAPGPASAESAEYVITFNAISVRGFVGLYDTPEIAHLAPPDDMRTPSSEHARNAAEPPGSPRRSPTAPESAPMVLRPTQPMAFAPGQGEVNPSFVEHGFLVEVFWAVRVGSPDGYYKRAHFHPAGLATGFEAQHLGNPDELHGIYIRSLDGKPFGVRQLRYRVTRNRQLPHKALSIAGFSNYNVNVLLARTFDPRCSIRGQFVGFPVGSPDGSDNTLPWWTLRVSGFGSVEGIYIASSASVDFDDIVLTRTRGAPDTGQESKE